ncbi:MAG: type IV pilus secretin PilQ, partial [Nitrospirae bacterium]|nr:type IV pilus secretin PilQ [Nitrospirota bacterium]
LPTSVDPFGAIGLTLGSIGNFFQLGVKLSAMEDAGMGRILSNPRIMTLNNGEAKISSGVKIPIQTVTSGTTTTSTAGSTSTTGIQTIEAFLRLTVTPQVTSDQRVLMKLVTEKDEPDWNRQVQGIPTIVSRKANSTLMVLDGETIVIGGILQRNESDSEHGVPGLSKIPLLGRLFRSDVKSDSQTELLIFITPKIVQGRV